MALDKLTKVQSVGISSFIQVVGVVTATGGFVGDLTGNVTGAATGDFSIADKIVHTGDTDTAIRFPAADTITAETGGTERLRITSAGLIGIGTVSPSGPIHAHVASGTQRSYLEASASHSFLRLKSGSTSYNSGLEFFSGASNIANVTGLGAGGLQFEVNGSERLLIDSAGNAILKTANGAFKSENPNSSGDYVRMYAGAGTAQWDIYGNGELLRMSENSANSAARVQFDLPTTHRSTSTTTGIAALTAQQEVNNGGYLIFDGKNSSGTSVFNVTHNGRVRVSDGIDFSTTSDASGMASELLDDYEEGTWTPALIGSSSNPSLTYGTQAGAYEKIGALVHASFFMQIGGVTSQGSGQLRIGGLPYTSAAGVAAGEVPGVILQAEPFNDGKGANRQQIVRTASQNYLLVGYRDLTTANVPIPTNGAANVGTGYFIGHITYRAS